MKKTICLFLCLLLCFGVLCAPASAAGFALPESVPLSAGSMYVMNLDTGLMVTEKNSNERRSIASLTKMMTVLLLMENVEDLDGTEITAPVDIYVPPITGGQASLADILPYETVTARSLLYGMLLPSGNEAAAIAAWYMGNGSLQNFYAMMNARAAELGCKDTNFSNPHGLGNMDEGNYSTAHDMALIAQACWQYDAVRTAAGTAAYMMPFTNLHTTPQVSGVTDAAYRISNTNAMIKPGTSVYRSYIRGLKTGSMMDAGRCFASVSVNDNGETYVCVVLGSTWDPAPDGYAYSFHDTAAVMDWVFDNFSVRPTLDIEKPTGEIPVELSAETDVVKLYPATDLRTILPLENSADVIEKEYDIPESIDAPVKRGDVVGTVTVKLQGEVVGTSDLIAGEDVARSPVLYAGRLIQNFFRSTYFYVVLALTVLFLVGYFLLMQYVRKQQRNRRITARRRQMQTGEMLSRELAPPDSAPPLRRDGRPAMPPGAQRNHSARRGSPSGFTGNTQDFDLNMVPRQNTYATQDFDIGMDVPPPAAQQRPTRGQPPGKRPPRGRN